ncbi:hypothetical protein ACU4GD_36385 [Cupriavidus basilensis]
MIAGLADVPAGQPRQLAQERLALAREQELRLQQLVNRLMVNDMQDGVMLLRANGVRGGGQPGRGGAVGRAARRTGQAGVHAGHRA